MDKKQQITSISTKTGDCGQTSLANGERVAKDSLVMEVVGTLDELNSWVGLVIVHAESNFNDQLRVLEQVQQDLYQLSAVIVKAPQIKFKKPALNRLEKQSQALEVEMAGEWQGKFLHPGGTKLAAQIDIARTICRRCERLTFKYSESGPKKVPASIISYLNRLSDYLYLLRCYVNLDQKHSEKTFTPDK
jgi:cob(I)alamin adenosyltransferase